MDTNTIIFDNLEELTPDTIKDEAIKTRLNKLTENMTEENKKDFLQRVSFICNQIPLLEDPNPELLKRIVIYGNSTKSMTG